MGWESGILIPKSEYQRLPQDTICTRLSLTTLKVISFNLRRRKILGYPRFLRRLSDGLTAPIDGDTMIGSRKTERDFFQSRDWLGRIQQTDCGGSTSQPPWEPCVPNIGESDDANPPPFPAIASDPISQPIQRQQLISIHACFAAMRAWQKTPKMGISGSVVHRDCGYVPEPKSPDLVTEIPHQPCPSTLAISTDNSSARIYGSVPTDFRLLPDNAGKHGKTTADW